LALGSGIARGWAHIGVLRALDRHGIAPDIIAGTSIGALVGGIFLAGHLEALERWARSLTKIRILSYMDFRGARGGLIGGQRLVRLMRDNLGDALIEDLPVPFVAITTDLVTGHEVWLRSGHMVDALRAAISLPGVFEPVQLGRRWLVDGALVNPVPVSVCQALGAQVTIAVNLNADIVGRARQSLAAAAAGLDLLNGAGNGGAAAAQRRTLDSLTRRVFRRDARQPSMLGVMVLALNVVQDRIARSRLAGEPPHAQVVPRLGHIGMLELHRAAEIIAEGEAAVERALPDIRAALTGLTSADLSLRPPPP
jgi:NTE family protein